jgi:hypothetical protein
MLHEPFPKYGFGFGCPEKLHHEKYRQLGQKQQLHRFLETGFRSSIESSGTQSAQAGNVRMREKVQIPQQLQREISFVLRECS